MSSLAVLLILATVLSAKGAERHVVAAAVSIADTIAGAAEVAGADAAAVIVV